MKYLYLDKPAYDPETEICYPDYKIEDGVFISGWKVEPKPDDYGYTSSPEGHLSGTQTLIKRTASEMRENAYNTEPVIEWGGSMLTVTEAAQRWAYYAAEGRTDKMDELTGLIAAAKADIRAQWPDNAGST